MPVFLLLKNLQQNKMFINMLQCRLLFFYYLCILKALQILRLKVLQIVNRYYHILVVNINFFIELSPGFLYPWACLHTSWRPRPSWRSRRPTPLRRSKAVSVPCDLAEFGGFRKKSQEGKGGKRKKRNVRVNYYDFNFIHREHKTDKHLYFILCRDKNVFLF